MSRTLDAIVIAERRQAVLYDKKWQKLLRRARLFRHIPFIEVIFAAGSMAMGNVKPTSDFDLIVGVRRGRLFTARFFLIVLCDLFGWRRRNLDHGEAAADTICLNHFVTASRYALTSPHGRYWQELYTHLVPLYGSETTIAQFYAANTWMGERPYAPDMRHAIHLPSQAARFFEKLLSRRVGDILEQLLRKPQLHRIQEKLVPYAGYKPRLIVSDDELELHLDTRRIEEFERG